MIVAIAAGQQMPARPNVPPQFLDLSALEPDEVTERGSRTWWVRG